MRSQAEYSANHTQTRREKGKWRGREGGGRREKVKKRGKKERKSEEK